MNIEKSEMQMYADVQDLIGTYLRQIGFIEQTSTNYGISKNLFGLNTSDEELKAIYLRDVSPELRISTASINEAIWRIIQWAQPESISLSTNTIFMDCYDTRRYGWVSTMYEWDKKTKTGKAVITWIRDIFFRLSFFKNRKALKEGAGVEFVSGLDVARKVHTWFQTDFGRDAMQEKGFQCLPIGTIGNRDFVAGSKQFERMPSFPITFVINERMEIDVTENYVTEIDQAIAFKNKNTTELIGV